MVGIREQSQIFEYAGWRPVPLLLVKWELSNGGGRIRSAFDGQNRSDGLGQDLKRCRFIRPQLRALNAHATQLRSNCMR